LVTKAASVFGDHQAGVLQGGQVVGDQAVAGPQFADQFLDRPAALGVVLEPQQQLQRPDRPDVFTNELKDVAISGHPDSALSMPKLGISARDNRRRARGAS
jgi:hypothetical protein